MSLQTTISNLMMTVESSTNRVERTVGEGEIALYDLKADNCLMKRECNTILNAFTMYRHLE